MTSMMSSHSYDRFERVLLNAAKTDQAPSDLPARLGVALGLGVPILVAAELASTLPATTSLAGVTASNLGCGATSTGLCASAVTTGASALWMVALKGLAIGFVSGSALLGTGHLVAESFNLGVTTPAATTLRHPDSQRASALADRRVLLAPQALPAAAPESPSDELEPALHVPVSMAVAAAARPSRGATVAVTTGDAQSAPKPVSAVPQTTTAVASFPVEHGDQAALYAGEKKAVLPLPPPAKPEPTIDPEEVKARRAKTLQRCRTLLGQSKAAQSLRELEVFRSHVGDRHFGVEELLLRVESLAALGRAKEAQATVARIERIAPNSAALRQARILARARFVR